MPNYKTMYFHLFNRVTDALRALEQKNDSQALELPKLAQQEGEEAYITET